MNDTTIKNKKVKLAKWNKCKINLNRELKVIDNKLNRFIKDSNNCISELNYNNKLNSYKKVRFGNTDDEEEGSEETTTGVISKLYIFIYKVLFENNINIKLYNCLLYGAFFCNTNENELYSTTFNRIEYDQYLNNSKIILDSFLKCLKNNNAYLAGGYINMATNYPSFENSYKTDLDIYVNKRDFLNLFNEIKSILTIIHYNFNISSSYTESFFKKNGLLTRVVLYLRRIKLDILIIRDDFDLKDVIKNFDLTYCSVYLDSEDLVIKGNIDDMINKSGKLNDDYAEKYLFNSFIQNRLIKYKKRGYKTSIKTKIDLVIEKNPPKVIEFSIIVHKFLEIFATKYQTVIQLTQLIYILSILEYSKINLIECAKKISTILYDDERYYYYILLEQCNSFLIDDNNPRYITQVMNDSKINPNFYKLIKMVTDFEKELRNIAQEKNEMIFTQKPNPINELIRYLFSEKVILTLKKLEPNFIKSEKLIEELKNIHKKNPNLEFNEILVKSSNKFLSNINYINLIMILISKEYKVYEDKWFMQQKASKASLFNFNYFKDEITQYNNDLDFRQIMFLDLYIPEEKPYEEVYEDSNNLLFVLEDDKTGFTYDFKTLTTDSLMDFILECKQNVTGAPVSNQIKNLNLWYVQLSAPFNIGVSVSQLYQAYSMYENSKKQIRKFVFGSPEKLNHISNIKVIQWPGMEPSRNIWGEPIDLIGSTHCGIGLKVYNKVMYVN